MKKNYHLVVLVRIGTLYLNILEAWIIVPCLYVY